MSISNANVFVGVGLDIASPPIFLEWFLCFDTIKLLEYTKAFWEPQS